MQAIIVIFAIYMMTLEKIFFIVMVAKYAEKVKEKILSIAILVMHALQNYLIINAKKIFLIKIVLFAWKIFFIQENSQLN